MKPRVHKSIHVENKHDPHHRKKDYTMKRIFLASAAVIASMAFSGIGQAAPPGFDCKVAQVHGGDFAFHFRCAADLGAPPQWYTIVQDSLSKIMKAEIVNKANPGGHVQIELTGGDGPCNPSICDGLSSVPEVRQTNSGFFLE